MNTPTDRLGRPIPTVHETEAQERVEREQRQAERAESDRIHTEHREREARRLQRERERQEQADAEERERLAPWLAECDRLESEVAHALAEVRACAFEVDCSSKKATKQSVERQIRLSAALHIAGVAERRFHTHEGARP